MSGVTPEASAAWLHAQLSADRRRLTDDLLMALAAHASPRAPDVLLAEARSGSTTHQRRQALFWLAQRAGDRAVGAISEAIDRGQSNDPRALSFFADVLKR